MNRKGFSLIELMVAVTILGLVLAAIITVLVNSSNAKRRNELLMESQGFARATMEVVLRDVKSIGYDIPKQAGLPVYEHIVYATPFEVIFNANITPYPDSIFHLEPRSYDPAANPQCPNFNLAASYNTGTETYRYTLDSNNDGLVDPNDNGDDSLEIRTRNPNDFVLIRQAYGRMNNGTNAVFPVLNQMVGLIRGPAHPADNSIAPLFQYWHRDNSGQMLLVGDTDGDGALTGNERLFSSPSADILRRIEEITITITTETRQPLDRKFLYPQTVVATRTNLANVPLSEASSNITGHYYDMGGGAIEGGNVFLSTFQVQTTDIAGAYSFRVENGRYTVTPEKFFQATNGDYYLLDHPKDSLVVVSGADRDNINFYFHRIASGDICHITGKVFHDSLPPIGDPVPDPAERGISGVRITVKGKPDQATQTDLSLEAFSDANGDYSVALPVGKYTVMETDSAGYFSSTPSVVACTLAAAGDAKTVNFGDILTPTGFISITVWNDADKDSLQGLGEAPLPNVYCEVTRGGYENIYVVSGRTDANGRLVLSVPADTMLSVAEYDPDTMSSTCAIRIGLASAPDSVVYPLLSRVDSIVVPEDSTYRVKFGDAKGFVTLALGTTQRVLSLICPNPNELRNPPGANSHYTTTTVPDRDIVLGTVKMGGISNLLIWYSRYQDASTPLGAMFPITPDFNFDLGYSIPALAYGDFDLVLSGGVSTDDIAAGLEHNVGADNFRIGRTNLGANPQYKDKGIIWSTVHNYSTFAGAGNADVISMVAGNLTNSGLIDLAVGTKRAGANEGSIEIWRNNSTAATFSMFRADTINTAGVPVALGEVNSMVLADVVDSTGTAGSDGLPDLIVGTTTDDVYPSYAGQLVIYRRTGQNGGFAFHWRKDIAPGYVNSVVAYQSGKASNSKIDIAIGYRKPGGEVDDHIGTVALFHNNDDGTFGVSGTPNQKFDLVYEGVGHEPLCLAAGMINIDNYTDLVVGTKTGLGDNNGMTLVFYTSPPGYLQTIGNDPSGGAYRGEVVVVRTAVLRPVPGRTDIVAGERFLDVSTGQPMGRVVIYFNIL